jgi:hypothetical protein
MDFAKNNPLKSNICKTKCLFCKKRSMDFAKKMEAKWKFHTKEVWILQKKWKQNGNFATFKTLSKNAQIIDYQLFAHFRFCKIHCSILNSPKKS